MVTIKKVKVQLGVRSYDIEIGSGLLENIPAKLQTISKGKQVILLSNNIVYSLYGEKLEEGLKDLGYQVLTQIIPEGEVYKTWEMAGIILEEILKARFNRDSIMISLGGGVIGDLGGFVASVYQRGIDFVQIPTTLLSQVDSSVGGKVAVNHPLGKNMIGSFYQPLAVYTDLDTLSSLPQEEWVAGLAEVVKYGVIWDKTFFEAMEKNIEQIKRREGDIVQELIRVCCEIKAQVVAKDEREDGLRAILNFGHTIGHGIERVTNYKVYRHGEGVAIGMVAAGKLAVGLELFTKEDLDRLEDLLINLGLPTTLPKDISIDSIIDVLTLDKKVRDQQLVFILPREIGKVEIIKGIKESFIKEVLLK